MSAPYDRQTLESMKRSDLQKICKDHGIKANLRSEALVDLLLDLLQPPQPANPAPEPKRASSLRVASRTTVGSRTRSTGTVVIHDSENEEDELAEPFANEQPEPPPAPDPSPPPRTRSAKESLFKLGIGRPKAAGGSGPRAISKSLSVSKGKRARGSRSMQPSEEAIREEDEDAEPNDVAVPEAGPSGLNAAGDISPMPVDLPEQLKSHVSQTIHPLQEHIRKLQTELQQTTSQIAEMPSLKGKVDALAVEVESLRAQVALTEQLRAEVAVLRESMSTLSLSRQSDTTALPSAEFSKSAGKARASDNDFRPSSSSSTLGKRQREPSDSEATADVEQAQVHPEKQLPKNVLQPSKKRAKLSQEHEATSSSQPLSPAREAMDLDDDEEALPITPIPPAPAFTVFSDPEEPLESYIDPPPPTARLSDIFIIPSSGSTPPSNNGAGPTTSTANGTENIQQSSAFNFNFTNTVFHPVTSTPAAPYGMELPSFTYPEAPPSPTPGAMPSGGYVERAGGRKERNDLFNPIGGPRRPRSPRVAGPSRPRSSGSQPRAATPPAGEGFIDPSELMRTPGSVSTVPEMVHMTSTSAVSSNEVGHGLGMSDMALPPETPALPMKRTMYGTELEGDTRFGDFGVEGVATGFWTGMAPRF